MNFQYPLLNFPILGTIVKIVREIGEGGGRAGRQFFLVPNFPRGARGVGGKDLLFIFGTFVKICETRTDEASSRRGEEKGKNKNGLCFRIGHKKVTIYIFLFPGDPLHSTA